MNKELGAELQRLIDTPDDEVLAGQDPGRVKAEALLACSRRPSAWRSGVGSWSVDDDEALM